MGPGEAGSVSGIFSRYQRMAGNRVLMISGTDENGTPIQVQADAEGVTLRELADKMLKFSLNLLDDLRPRPIPATSTGACGYRWTAGVTHR